MGCRVYRTENRLRNRPIAEGSRRVHMYLESVKVQKWIQGTAVGVGYRCIPIQNFRRERGSSAGGRFGDGIRGTGAAPSATAGKGRQYDDQRNNDGSSRRYVQFPPPFCIFEEANCVPLIITTGIKRL